jgi:hypothetical protein
MKIAVFWLAAPCSPVEVNRRFTCAFCFHHQADKTTNSLLTVAQDWMLQLANLQKQPNNKQRNRQKARSAPSTGLL